MVFVDIPGLPRDLDVRYRPSRLSLFPPSYRDRAFLRSVHRDVLRQIESKTNNKEDDKKKNGKTVTIELPFEKTDKQKPDHECEHECSVHNRDGKKLKGTEKKASKDQTNKKKGQKDRTGEADDDDGNSGHECKHKGKDKSSKSNDKGRDREDETKLKVPEHLRSFLPYPFTSANANILWGNTSFQKPFPEKSSTNKDTSHGWNIDQRLENARRADEKYLWSYLSQQEASYQTDAFQWLAQRDGERQNRLAHLTRDLGSLSLDPEVGRVPINLGLGYHLPQTGHYSHGMYDGQPRHNDRYNHTSLQATVDKYGNIRLADGTMVVVNGQCANGKSQRRLFDVGPPLASTNQGINNGHQSPFARQNQPLSPPQGFNRQYHQGGFQSNTPYPPRNAQDQNGASNGNKPFQSWNTPQHESLTNGNAQNNNDAWNTGGNNAGNQNNDPWVQNNSTENRNVWDQNANDNAWGQNNLNRNNNGWIQTSNYNSGANNYTWGDGNDENHKPNSLFNSDADNVFQDNVNEQSGGNGFTTSNKNGPQNDTFFNDGPTANDPAAGRSMSGARGLGSKSFPAYADW